MRWILVVAVLGTVACGNDNNVAPIKDGTNNGTANNGTTGSNNGSTVGTNNGTATNNGSTNATNNSTGSNTTGTNACDPLEPPLGDCDPLCQTGCEVGEHCLINIDSEVSCGGSGPRVQDEACSADTECALGFHCRSVGGADSTCLAYCGREGGPSCPGGYACVRLAADERIGACVPINDQCDVVPTDDCADPEECYDTAQGRQCLPSGDVAADAACQLSSDCQAGLRCVNVQGEGQVCKPLCDPNGAADCAERMCRTLSNQNGQPLSWGACF